MSDDLVKRLDSLWAMLEEDGFYTKANTVVLAKNRIEALEAENERLRHRINHPENLPKRYCAKCGHPEDDHPYRHPFVAGGISSKPDAALETKGKGKGNENE